MIRTRALTPTTRVLTFTDGPWPARSINRSRIPPAEDGTPRSAGSCPMMIVIASPITKPVTTDLARNCDMKPSLATPAASRNRPTSRASIALSSRYRGSPATASAPTTAADITETEELVVTFRCRVVPKTA